MCTNNIQTQCRTAGLSDYLLLDREKENMLRAITKGSVGRLCASQFRVCRDSALAALTLSSSRLAVHMNIKERWETEEEEEEREGEGWRWSGVQYVRLSGVCEVLLYVRYSVTWSVSMVSVKEKSWDKLFGFFCCALTHVLSTSGKTISSSSSVWGLFKIKKCQSVFCLLRLTNFATTFGGITLKFCMVINISCALLSFSI